jgi:hypothetical protein
MKLFVVVSRSNGVIGVYSSLKLANEAMEAHYEFESFAGNMFPSVSVKEVKLDK